MPKPPELMLKREFTKYQKEIEKRLKQLEKGAKIVFRQNRQPKKLKSD